MAFVKDGGSEEQEIMQVDAGDIDSTIAWPGPETDQKHRTGMVLKGSVESDMIPIVDRARLASIQISTIRENVKIMHNLFMDEDYTFGLSLTRDSETRLKEKLYWDNVNIDLAVFRSQLGKGSRALCPLRIKLLLETIIDTAKDLFAHCAKFQELFKEHFDLVIIIQELEAGQLDLFSFTKCFCEVIKSVCRPTRKLDIGLLLEYARLSLAGQVLQGIMALLVEIKMDLLNAECAAQRHQLSGELPQLEARFFEEWRRGRYPRTRKLFKSIHTRVGSRVPEDKDTTFLLFAHGLTHYTLGIDFIDHELKLPETFVLDQELIRDLRCEAAQLCMVAAAIGMLYQVVKRDHGMYEAARLKRRLFATIEAEGSTASMMAEAVISSVLAVNPRAELDLAQLKAQYLDLVDACNPVYKMLQSRLASYMLDALCKRTLVVPSRFRQMAEEVAEFGQRFAHLGMVNWRIHSRT